MRVKLTVGEERARCSVYRCVYGRYCGKLLMNRVRYFSINIKNIEIYVTTMQFVSPNFESINHTELLTVRSSLHLLQWQIFPVQISGPICIKLLRNALKNSLKF